jgi:hypothetical protein
LNTFTIVAVATDLFGSDEVDHHMLVRQRRAEFVGIDESRHCHHLPAQWLHRQES